MAVASSQAENTCNALLCEELRKLGLEAWFEEHFLTKFGLSKPDIHIIYKEGNYFLEAKQRPRRLVDAVSKAYTYQKKLGVYSPKAIFAALYSEDCQGRCDGAVLLNQPPFYVANTVGSIKDLAQWIYQTIAAPPVELNTEDAIKLLREAVLGISEVFSALKAKDVEDIFGGRMFFETVLGIKEERHMPTRYLRDAAAYLLVNQILFYQILAKETGELRKYEEISSEGLNDPKELQTEYFSKVLLKDYKPIFGFDITARISGSRAVEALRVAIDAVNALSPQSLSHDILGKVFHNLIPLDLRKVIAAFYTNIQAGEMLASLAVEGPGETVLDPACGSGTLLVSSYQRKKCLVEAAGEKFTFRHHKRFVEDEITGIDIMPFAAHLAAVHLSLQAPLYTTDFVRIAIQDSTALKPGDVISAAQEVLKNAFRQRKLTEDLSKSLPEKEKVVTGAVQLTEEGNRRPIPLSSVDVVIMNPPFTRFQRILPEYKSVLAKRFAEPAYERCVHGLLGLHGYFLLLADRFVKHGGRLAAVLPLTTLSIKGFYGLQDLWFDRYSLQYIVSCGARSAFSENTALREILFVARKGETDNNEVAFVTLKVSPNALSIRESRSIAEELKHHRETATVGTAIDTEKYLFRLLPQSELRKSKRSLFRTISISSLEMSNIDSRLTGLFNRTDKVCSFSSLLQSIGGDVNENPRGMAQYGYFGLSIFREERRALKNYDAWVMEKAEKTRIVVKNRFSGVVLQVPTRSLQPHLRRFSGMETMDITDNCDLVLAEPYDSSDIFLQNSLEPKRLRGTKRLLDSGEWDKFIGKHSSYCFLFYRGDLTAPHTHCVALCSSKETFAGAGGSWVLRCPLVESKIITLWFNSTLNLFQILTQRKETRGGWMEIDSYVLEETTALNTMKLTSSEREDLLRLYERVAHSPLPSIRDQLRTEHHVRKEIDVALLRLLEMPENQIEGFLSDLYRALFNELEQLREVMSEGRTPTEGEEDA